MFCFLFILSPKNTLFIKPFLFYLSLFPHYNFGCLFSGPLFCFAFFLFHDKLRSPKTNVNLLQVQSRPKLGSLRAGNKSTTSLNSWEMKTLEGDSFESNDTFATCCTQPHPSPTVSFGPIEESDIFNEDAAVLDQICDELTRAKTPLLKSQQPAQQQQQTKPSNIVQQNHHRTIKLPKWFSSRTKSECFLFLLLLFTLLPKHP